MYVIAQYYMECRTKFEINFNIKKSINHRIYHVKKAKGDTEKPSKCFYYLSNNNI